jgi:hydroxymethylbilane synthase
MILGTQSNRISIALANMVLKRMSETHPAELVELKIVAAAGEVGPDRPFSVQRAGEFNLLEEKLRSGEIDVITVNVDDISLDPNIWSEVVSILPRGPVEDVLVSPMPLRRLRPGSVIGISSVRQKSSLLNLRPDLYVKDLREKSNARLDIGSGLEGFIVSRAGLELLRIDCPSFILDPEQFIPGPGQGAVAVLCRSDSRYRKLLVEFNDHDTRVCVESERFLLEAMGEGISVPVGIWAVMGEEDIRIRAIVLDVEGTTSFRLDRSIDLDRLAEGLDAFAMELKYSWELVR